MKPSLHQDGTRGHAERQKVRREGGALGGEYRIQSRQTNRVDALGLNATTIEKVFF